MSEPDSLSIVVVGNERMRVPVELPVLPVRDAVVFPGMNVPLSVGRARSLAALEEAGDGGFLVVATQKSPETEEPELADLHPIACIARIVRVVDARGQARQALVLGLARTRLGAAPAGAKGALRARLDPLNETVAPSAEAEAARSRVVQLAHRAIDLHDDYPDEWKNLVSEIPTPGLLADLIASNVALSPEERIVLLCEPDPVKRLWRVASALEREVTIAETQHALSAPSGPGGRGPEAPRAPAAPAHARHPEGARRGRRAACARRTSCARTLEAADLPAEARRARRARAAAVPRPAPARARSPPGAQLRRVDRRPALVEGDRRTSSISRTRGACSTKTTTTSRR